MGHAAPFKKKLASNSAAQENCEAVAVYWEVCVADRAGTPRLARKTCLYGAVAITLQVGFSSVPAHAETIGLVMTNFSLGGPWTTDGKKECPEGFNTTNQANFEAQYKTPEERREVTKKYGSLQWHYRGPNGESDVYNPEAVPDPLPHFDGQGTVSDGMNLDGTQDGQATDKTCKHAKYTSPTGEQVDNQLYRALGCVKSVRPLGLLDAFTNMEIPQLSVNRWVLEITGVDSRVNDDHVEITIAHGLDELVADGNGGFVAGRTQRINEGASSYVQRATGRIKDGVLYSDVMPMLRLTVSGIIEAGERRFSDARFRLKLTETGATGMIAAYSDIARLYRYHAKTIGLHGVAGTTSMPSFYRALWRHADGHKDPATGQCTSISGHYAVNFVNANIVRPSAVAEVAETIAKRAADTRR